METSEYSLAPGRKENTVAFSAARITLITDRLIRLEWSEDGVFEDRPTLAVTNRDCGKVSFRKKTSGKETLIRTEKLTVRYLDDGKKFSPKNLSVSFELNGKTVISGKYPEGEIPVFAKAGAIIPTQSGVRDLNGKCYKNLGCTVYPGESGEYLLYEDDGISSGYLSGKFALIRFAHHRTASARIIEVKHKSGSFDGFEEKRSLEIRLPGVIPPSGVRIGNVEIPNSGYPDEHAGERYWHYDGDRAEIRIFLPEISLIRGVNVSVFYAGKDEFSKAAGLKGIFAVMKEIAGLQDSLDLRGAPFGNERLGRELAATGRRISLAPITFGKETANFRKKYPLLKTALRKAVQEKPEMSSAVGKALKLFAEVSKLI